MSVQFEANLSPRTLVLCFDGTGNVYGTLNTNIVKFFALLKKDCRDEQLVYYQTGIGTYLSPGRFTGVLLSLAKVVDQAVAWYLDAHVMDGYKFLMQNYRTGDRICLFGFSRGAYTARALAGMLHKVGLLPKDNLEQIGFAYQIYKGSGKENSALAKGYKQTFSKTVNIEFMGCWDTVASVGILWKCHLPFTSSNTIIKYFRHALSLDERRAKFQPNTWHRIAPNSTAAKHDPEGGSCVLEENVAHDGPRRAATDVLEVWFSGCHGDVGGGTTPSGALRTLSAVSLRWMVREVVRSQCGIQFDTDALVRADIPLSMLSLGSNSEGEILTRNSSQMTESGPLSDESTNKLLSSTSSPFGTEAAKDDAQDAVQPMFDQLLLQPLWWILELIPLAVTWQDEAGIWHRTFRWNLGRGRNIWTAKPKLHTTVLQREETKSLAYVAKAKWPDMPDVTWVT